MMHAPDDYDCPFCRVVRGEASRRNRPDHVVHRDALTTALVAPKWWRAAPGHILVVPNDHVENLYDLSDELAGAVLTTARAMALTLKRLDGCEGTSLRQHNEPGGNQDVWHLHVHVFPRTRGDRLYERHAEVWWPDVGVVSERAASIRRALASTG